MMAKTKMRKIGNTRTNSARLWPFSPFRSSPLGRLIVILVHPFRLACGRAAASDKRARGSRPGGARQPRLSWCRQKPAVAVVYSPEGFRIDLELAGDGAEGARNRQTQCGQRHDADHRDQSQKQTVLGQRLPILTLESHHERQNCVIHLREHLVSSFQKIDRLLSTLSVQLDENFSTAVTPYARGKRRFHL